MKTWYYLAFAAVAASMLSCGGCAYWAGSSPYSTGHREGRLQKFSRRGVLAKTWEGELALPGFQGQGKEMSNVWAFTVDDSEAGVIAAFNDTHAEQLIRVHYVQWLFWNPLRGDTGYRVVRVEVVNR